MPVDFQRQEYEAMCGKWERMRDCYAGSDAVKAAGKKYLLPLDSHLRADAESSGKFKAYVERAVFYNAVRRTVQGLSGAVFQREPSIELPGALKDHLRDVTLDGVTAETFGFETMRELLIPGRAGVMVDVPEKGERPRWSRYTAESIYNWRTFQWAGRRMLSLVVLRERIPVVDEDDPFEVKLVDQFRVLRLSAIGASQTYVQNVWEKVRGEGGAEKWVAGPDIYPKRRGSTLDFIPFTFVGPTSIAPEPEDPPLDDLAIMNLCHYRLMADLQHGRHWVSLPTPVISDDSVKSGKGTPIRIGSGEAIVLGTGGSASMLEVRGEGLGSLERGEKDFHGKMASLGARLLEDAPSQPETYGAVSMRHAGDQASLRGMVQVLEQALSQVCRWHAWWEGGVATPDDVEGDNCKYELNKEFFQMRSSPEAVRAAMDAYLADAISYKTFYEAIQRGGWARDGVTAEEEQKEIEIQQQEKREEFMAANGGMTPEQAAAKAALARKQQGAPPAGGGSAIGQGDGDDGVE
jgi:hypothetical protein